MFTIKLYGFAFQIHIDCIALQDKMCLQPHRTVQMKIIQINIEIRKWISIYII